MLEVVHVTKRYRRVLANVGGWKNPADLYYESGWIGYNELAAGQTEAVANGIYNLATFFPAAIYILCGLVLMFIFPLNKARVDANVAELKSRRG